MPSWMELFARVLPVVGTAGSRVRGIWTGSREVGLGSRCRYGGIGFKSLLSAIGG